MKRNIFFFKCMQPRFLVRDKQGGAVSSYKQCNLEQICSFLWCLFTSEFYSYSWQGYLCKEKTFLVSLESIPPWRLIAKLIACSPMSQETEGITAPCVWVSRGQTNRTHGTSEGFPAPSLLSLCVLLPGLPPLRNAAWPLQHSHAQVCGKLTEWDQTSFQVSSCSSFSWRKITSIPAKTKTPINSDYYFTLQLVFLFHNLYQQIPVMPFHPEKHL